MSEEQTDAYVPVSSDARYDDPAMREAYAEGMEWACAQLGHQTRLGEDACICGRLTSTEHVKYERALDRYHALAADALCAEHDQGTDPIDGTTGWSWRDGTCSCDYDVRAVLKAIGSVAAHVGCREEMDHFQRIIAALTAPTEEARQMSDRVESAIRMLDAEAEDDSPSGFADDVAVVLDEIDRLTSERDHWRTIALAQADVVRKQREGRRGRV